MVHVQQIHVQTIDPVMKVEILIIAIVDHLLLEIIVKHILENDFIFQISNLLRKGIFIIHEENYSQLFIFRHFSNDNII